MDSLPQICIKTPLLNKGVSYMGIKTGNKKTFKFNIFDFEGLNEDSLKVINSSNVVILVMVASHMDIHIKECNP